MARDGAVFRHAVTATPVCSPTHACLLTGLPCSRHGVHDFIYDADPACGERDWLAGQLKLAECGATGTVPMACSIRSRYTRHEVR